MRMEENKEKEEVNIDFQKERTEGDYVGESVENITINSKYENLIGILLIIPIYMIVVPLGLSINSEVVLGIILYLPMIVGVMLSYKICNKNTTNKTILTCILVLLCTSIYCFINTYFIDHPGWDGIGYYLLIFIVNVIMRIFSVFFLRKNY